MNREVHIYIEGKTANNYDRIDLFKDENINVSSSIQNIQDLSKVYTDFSQSFTVPATPNNNKIFEYFYENDIDNAIDHNLRRYAFIEIGYVPFRSGKIQLEGSSIKDGKAEHYTITFYGDLVSLKDTFGNLKINSLDFSSISNPYTATEVINRITNTTTDYDVRYPLISSQRLWTYGDATSTDISTTKGAIIWNELYPAIKVSKIFDAIETKFNITFQSAFIQTELFKKLFLWCKNTDNQDAHQKGSELIVDSYFNSNPGAYDPLIYDSASNSYLLYNPYSLSYPFARNDVFITINNSSVVVFIDIYINGILKSTSQVDTSVSNTSKIYVFDAYAKNKEIMTLKVRTLADLNLTYTIKVDRKHGPNQFGNFTYIGYATATKSIPLPVLNSSNSIDLNMQDITIADFFSGILKQFNLTCYMSGYNNYIIEPLDDWYTKGGIINITPFVDTDTIEVDRLPLYKNIEFNYEKSESFINRKFADIAKREYGDTSLNYDYDGGDYKIQVPFENLNFQKFSNTTLQVGYSLTKEPDFKSYIPKPIILYYNGSQTSSVKINNGSTTSTYTNLALFGQDLSYNNDIYSLNFSPDNSTWYNKPIQNSLFAIYYFGYLSNLFNSKNRLTKLSAYFPISLITSLKLNDRLIIKDKRYLINSIASELTNGKVQLELINDFREVKNLNKPYNINDLSGNVFVDVNIGNDTTLININSSTSGVAFSTTTFTEDSICEVSIPSNPIPRYILTTEDNMQLVTNEYLTLISEQGSERFIDINFVQTKKDGTTETYTQYIIQGE